VILHDRGEIRHNLIPMSLNTSSTATAAERKVQGFYMPFKSWWNQLSLSHESNQKKI